MSIEKLNTALAQALGDLSEPHKGGKADTGSYGYTYLTLPDLSRVVRQAFAKHGLGFTQHVHVVEGGVEVTTRLVHTSGATWSTDPLWMPAAARNSQAIGSAITYARRYQLAALVGLSGSDDDDGAQAAGRDEPHEKGADAPSSHPAAKASPPSRGGSSRPAHDLVKRGPQGDREPTEKQLKALATALNRQGWSSPESMHAQATAWARRPVESLKDLTRTEVSDWLDELFNMPKATRVTASAQGEPPEDPWADAEQAVMS